MIDEKNRTIALFTIPDSLNFYLNEEDGCKQKIKIYNIHDFTINFKVLCTSVDKYSVEPPFGFIRPKCMIDISIRLKNHDFDRKKDIFKIDAHSKENEKIIGEKEITAYIKPEKPLEELNKSREKNEELKDAKSDNLNNSYKRKGSLNSNPVTIQLDQNVVIITTGKFCFYVILIFLVGMIVGMIINAPSDKQLGLD